MKNEFTKWADAHKKFAMEELDLLWPSETLVRLFKGDYVHGLEKAYPDKNVLDIGCGNGNNLIFLSTLGLQCSGVEVTPDICSSISAKLQRLEISADIQCGSNTKLPFADNSFDFLVSWNVLHYESNEADIHTALDEYQRVLKPGGRFFISTTGPEHKILKDSQNLGDHRFQIGREDDFRKGQVFYYFESEENIKRVFSKHFREILTGRTHDRLMIEILDWFIVTGIKE